MATLKYQKNVKIAVVTLVLALMLFIEPALAERKSNKSSSSKSSGGSAKSQQVSRSSSASRTQQPSSSRSSSSRMSTSLRSIRPPTRTSTARPSGRSSSISSRSSSLRSTGPGRTTSFNIRMPSTGVTNRQPGRMTVSRPVTIGPRVNSSTRKPSSISIGSREPTTISSSTGRQTSTSSGNRISSGRSSLIGSLIGTRSPSARSTQPQAGSSGNRISSGISSRIGSSITTRRPTTRTTQKPSAGSSSSRISSGISSRIGNSIRDRKTSVPTSTGRPARSSKLRTGITGIVGNRSSRVSRKSEPSQGPRDGYINKEPEKRPAISRQRKSTNLRGMDRLSPGSRIRKVVPERRTTVVDTVVVHDAQRGDRTSLHSYRIGRSPHVTFHDRPHVIRHVPHYEHSYIDWRHRLCHRTIWPRYRFMMYYSYGPWFTFRYFYPYYHRKYIFVSLGGYWPLSYRYRRYYWYGYHPYSWYGYYPIAREVLGDTYNYYTYNYYTDDNSVVSGASPVIDGIQPVDHNTFADVREKLAQQAAEEPGEVTPADICFETAVKAFEADNYDVAIEKFAEAMELAPDDMILPFAYSQALFAKEQYYQAAEVLRGVLAKVSPDKEGVFYPRGLYSDDDVLYEQINVLAEKAELYSFDADLQLLLGYQLLGIGNGKRGCRHNIA